MQKIRSLAKASLLFLLLLPPSTQAADFNVAQSGRHLLLNGRPFFWLADTSWLLAQVPSRDDLELYLRTRKKQGFSVIQFTSVMAEERVWGTTRANAFGDKPFVNDDSLSPAVTPGQDPNDPAQYDYWDHLDHVIDRVHGHGLQAAIVVMFVGWQGEGYKYLKKDNALQFGRFLGERYRSKPQIIWLLGGDNTPDNPDKKEVWNLMAKGITEGVAGKEDYAQTMMTYHINGGSSSSQIWHNAPWLDFNMAQTWSAYTDIYQAVHKDYLKSPPKPCGLGEGAYEDGPQYPTKPINDLVIRKQAYWSYFAGGYHTYGNGNVWHFDTVKNELTQHWKEALTSPGAEDLLTLRNFLEAVHWANFVPDQRLLGNAQGSGVHFNCAQRSAQGDEFIFYLTGAGPIQLALGLPPGAPRAAEWVNPSTGEKKAVEEFPRDSRVSLPSGWSDALLWIKK